MASNDLIIDDDSLTEVNDYLEKVSKLETLIDDYIAKMQATKDTAIMNGEIANSLQTYIGYASSLKGKTTEIITGSQGLIKEFVQEIEEADKLDF